MGMMPDILVTFMIATRNRVDELEKTLAACLAQDFSSYEILVVDDASSDGTFERVRTRFPHVNIVRRERNQGSIAARNDIVRRAKGKYIIGLDDDSRFVDLDACRRVVARLEAEPDLGIISFQAIGPEHPERMTEAGRLAANGIAVRSRRAASQFGGRCWPRPVFFQIFFSIPTRSQTSASVHGM